MSHHWTNLTCNYKFYQIDPNRWVGMPKTFLWPATTTWTKWPRCRYNSWWTSASRWSATRRRSWAASTPWELKFLSIFLKDFLSEEINFILTSNECVVPKKTYFKMCVEKKLFCLLQKRFSRAVQLSDKSFYEHIIDYVLNLLIT